MAKKKTEKQKKVSKRLSTPKEVIEKDERDFGGFPDRDLKKNLGCG